MKLRTRFCILWVIAACVGLGRLGDMARAQETGAASGPDPREIPVPWIQTAMGTLPGVIELPIRKEMPGGMGRPP
jgi:hypothetical protein